MTDDKKVPDELGEVDWESALSDWENKTFVPEVAKDIVTEKPAALAGRPMSRPLYRPPQAPPAKTKVPAPPIDPIPSFIVADDEDDDVAPPLAPAPPPPPGP